MGELRTATVLAANRSPLTLPLVRDAACSGGEAFPPVGASAAADSLQELSLSGVTHVSGAPSIHLSIFGERERANMVQQFHTTTR